MPDEAEVEIKVRHNGPYKVTGPVRLIDADGNEYDVGERGDGRPLPLRRLSDQAVLRQDPLASSGSRPPSAPWPSEG